MNIRYTLPALAASALLLSACADPASINTDDGFQKTRQGALLGGALGAGIAAITGGSALKGAVIGAAAGGVTGSILDKQANELRQDIGNTNITVENTGDRLIVSLPNDITFGIDSYTVHSTLRNDIGAVADSLKKYPDSVVQVLGHTDNTGDAGYNVGLSERRAEAVADVLMDHSVPFERIETIGHGEDQPIGSNLTEEGRAKNRRVEIVILPNG